MNNLPQEQLQLSLFSFEGHQIKPLALPQPKAKKENSSTGFELRPYQKKVIADLYSLVREGKRRPFIYAPTGAGKTAIASRIIRDAITKERPVAFRVLFLIHRDPLLEQTQEALSLYGIETGAIKSGHKEDRTKTVQIASIQTLARRALPENIGLVIIDECHTCSFHSSYSRIKEAYPEALFVGLTASPWRTKSVTQYMGMHFDSIVKAPSPKELIRLGYLAPPRYFGWGGLVDLSKVNEDKEGDFNNNQMQSAYLAKGVSEKMVEEYIRLCKDRTAIAFCAGVEQSRQLTKLFNDAGITAEHLEAATPHYDRKQMYDRLRRGETRILSSVGTLTEGFDVPSISAIILARATRSRALLFQMCGRGLRLHPGKVDCLMLDFGENFDRLKFITTAQQITLEPIPKPEGEPATKDCPNCHATVWAFQMICPICGYEFPPGEEEPEDDLEFEAEFGELFPPEEREKFDYLREEIRRRFTKRQPIDRVWELFSKRYGHQPPNAWHLGTVFGTARTNFNRQLYLDYLHEINPNPPEAWIKFHIELEFGRPGREYKSRKGSYTPPANQHKQVSWWEVLGVAPFDPWEDIKSAYRQWALEFHPDTSDLDPGDANERMKLINWAWEKAKAARDRATPPAPTN